MQELAQLQEQELGAFHQDEINQALDWERQKEIDQEKAEDLFRKGSLVLLSLLVFSAGFLFLKAHSLSMAHMNAAMRGHRVDK